MLLVVNKAIKKPVLFFQGIGCNGNDRHICRLWHRYWRFSGTVFLCFSFGTTAGEGEVAAVHNVFVQVFIVQCRTSNASFPITPMLVP